MDTSLRRVMLTLLANKENEQNKGRKEQHGHLIERGDVLVVMLTLLANKEREQKQKWYWFEHSTEIKYFGRPCIIVDPGWLGSGGLHLD